MTRSISRTDVQARSIRELIKAAGGREAIAQATARSPREVSAEAVQKWKTKGIPHWHWPVVMKLAGATESEILAANQALVVKPRRGGGSRGGSRRRPRVKRRAFAEVAA